MRGMCSICYQEIPENRSLCDACENDLRAEQAEDGERLFLERQTRAMCVE